jgi:hypothetical protein
VRRIKMAILTQVEIIEIKDYIVTIPSKRARLLEAMRLILETITTGRGYSKTVCEVSYDVKGWETKSEDQTPVIYIIDDTTDITRHAGCIREYRWRVRLYGVFKGGDNSIVDLEKFISDIEQCIYDNNTLASEVNKMEIDQITTDNQLFSVQQDSHLFEIVVTIEYTRKARNSR